MTVSDGYTKEKKYIFHSKFCLLDVGVPSSKLTGTIGGTPPSFGQVTLSDPDTVDINVLGSMALTLSTTSGTFTCITNSHSYW